MHKKHLNNVGYLPKVQEAVLAAEPLQRSEPPKHKGKKPFLCSVPKLESGARKDLSSQCNKPEKEALSPSWESLEQGNLAGKTLLVTK